jgi:hypothetical protein
MTLRAAAHLRQHQRQRMMQLAAAAVRLWPQYRLHQQQLAQVLLQQQQQQRRHTVHLGQQQQQT